MPSYLMIGAAILLAGLSLYRSEAADREVASSLEALRHEIRRVSEAGGFSDLGAVASDPAPGAAQPRAETPQVLDRKATPFTPPRPERVAMPTSSRPEDRRSARGWARDEPARPGLSAGAIDRLEERRRASEPARRARRLALLESPVLEERASAVFQLDAEDDQDLAALRTAIVDPDASVRIEAVRRLQFGEPRTAVPLLLQALEDSEPNVVAEAVDSLKFVGDSSSISDLEPLLESPSPRIRREAGAAIERLR